MKTVKANNIGLSFFGLFLAVIALLGTANAQSTLLNPNINPNLFQPSYDFYKPILTTPLLNIRIPSVTIISPAYDSGVNDSIYAYDGYDDARGMWYKDITLTGTAVDGYGNPIAASSVQWSTSRTDIQTAHLGNGQTIHTRLYSNSCFGSDHVITLASTDSNGSRVSVTRRINIWTLC